jgi:23S rRNA (cytosine1962-C5)-methyltransferase
MQANLILAAGKERAPMQGHPWIFSGAIKSFSGKMSPGSTVTVHSDDGKFVGRAAYSPSSQIRARIWSWDENEPIDHAFFKRKIATAIAHRNKWVKGTNAIRLIFGEADGLPGLVVDQYSNILVCQFLSAGVEHWKSVIVDILQAQTGCETIIERSDAAVREREGLPLISGVLYGELKNPEVIAMENEIQYLINPFEGHKTGFYIDQRDNRGLVAQWSKNCRVLNTFCYTGGFSLAALYGGASEVISVDSSGDALAVAKRQVELNGFDQTKAQWLDRDAFEVLKEFRVAQELFDIIILDPPKFAPSAQHLSRAKKAYKDINRSAMQMLKPGGLLFTFSCSGAMDLETFDQTVIAASVEAASHKKDENLKFRVLKRLTSGQDHPKLISFPEGDYLKGLLLERI